jgi:iron-sulfur cluster repair protein YtfE (RIC family)
MLHNIGKRPVVQNVVEMLSECHHRIRSHLALSRLLATAADGPGKRAAIEQVRRYFRDALPLHVSDEEELMAACLRRAGAGLDDALAQMTREHAEMEPDLQKLIADPEHPPEGLEERFLDHLQLEERVIFPVLRSLPHAVQDRLVAEMRARRWG